MEKKKILHRKKRIEIWLHSAAGIVSVTMVVTSIILIVIVCSNIGSGFMTEKAAANANNILIGLSTNFIGITITVSFVQYFLDKQDEKEGRRKEIKIIKRYDKYLQTLIRRYLMYYMSVTIRLKDRETADVEHPYEHTFKFSDLADMYCSSMYITEGRLDPSITVFFKAEEKLCDYMLRMLENIDFTYNPDLEGLLLEFVTKSVDFDMRGKILGVMDEYTSNRKRFSETVSKMIADESKDWLLMYKRGELKESPILPYVFFYYNIQDQVRILKNYSEYLKIIDQRKDCET